MAELPHESIDGAIDALVLGLAEAADRGSLRRALRTCEAWELRLVICRLLGAAPAPERSPEGRAAILLNVDGNCELLRRP